MANNLKNRTDNLLISNPAYAEAGTYPVRILNYLSQHNKASN